MGWRRKNAKRIENIKSKYAHRLWFKNENKMNTSIWFQEIKLVIPFLIKFFLFDLIIYFLDWIFQKKYSRKTATLKKKLMFCIIIKQNETNLKKSFLDTNKMGDKYKKAQQWTWIKTIYLFLYILKMEVNFIVLLFISTFIFYYYLCKCCIPLFLQKIT